MLYKKAKRKLNLLPFAWEIFRKFVHGIQQFSACQIWLQPHRELWRAGLKTILGDCGVKKHKKKNQKKAKPD